MEQIMEQVIVNAFSYFKEIDSLPTIQEKQRAWLRLHEGLNYGYGVDGKMRVGWEWTKHTYRDSLFDVSINYVGRLPNQIRIEFDGDVDKAKADLELTEQKLISLGIGFIRSTHKGKSDYLWIEFDKHISDKQAEAFLAWIAPEGSTIDLNFASSKKIFPVLYAVHGKHSYQRELPIKFIEGKQINFDSLGIKNLRVKKSKAVSSDGFEYETFDNKPSNKFNQAAQIFSGKIELAKRFMTEQPIYFDEGGLWWIWNHKRKCWEITNEIDITNHIYYSIGINTVNATERNEIIQALKQVGRMQKPKSLPKTMIQFKDRLFDIISGEEIDSTPEYFSVNPIPYSLHKDKFIETPVMDRIFEEWVGRDNIKTLYQIIAYCLLPDYPIHRLFCFIGGGMNGKSCYLRLIEKFIGLENCCSTELDSLLNSRFEVTRLHKKLVCIMGETNFNEISKTSILKKLTGQDLIGFEYKNKNPFEERNYAKILISTNNLPETTDKTIGFYRRWMIIDFPNSFSEQKDILKDIPEEEYEILAVKCVSLLHDLLQERKFYNEGSIEDRQKVYEEKSNPFDKFYKENIDESDPNTEIPKWEFEKRLNEWCKLHRFREMSEMVIAKKMKEKGILEVKPYKEWYENNQAVKRQVRCWGGLQWKL